MLPKRSRRTRAQQADITQSEALNGTSEGRTLPDEIVREILIQSPGLIIPYDLFIKTDDVSPFADTSHVSSSLISVVCKQWLRVATPLLYHTIIVRSKAQGQALERAIRANKEFAKFIKRIRIEVAYGPPMRTILPLATNITDIFVTIDVFSTDNADGLTKMLPSLKPTTLILWTSAQYSECKGAIALRDTLLACISHHWSTLERIYLSPSSVYRLKPGGRLALSLSSAPSLRTIHIDAIGGDEEFWNVVATSKTLSQINAVKEGWSIISSACKARKLVRVAGRSLDEPANPDALAPLAFACSKFDDRIWSRILKFAMDPNISLDRLTSSSFMFNEVLQIKRHIWNAVNVCKTFYRLGLPYLYSFPYLRTWTQHLSFFNHVSDNPALASNIRSILFCDSYRVPLEDTDTQEERFVAKFQAVMKVAPVEAIGTRAYIRNGRVLTMPWRAFEAICDGSSESSRTLTHLHPLHLSPPSFPSLLTAFNTLRNVRYLNWRSDIVSKSHINSSIVSSTCFPLLEHLEYEEANDSQSKRTLLEAMALMTLPCLKSFKLVLRGSRRPDVTSFLNAHGHKIITLAMPFAGFTSPFASCPNLAEITDASSQIKWNAPSGEFFSKHVSLKKITYEVDSASVAKNEALFYPSLYSCFTALEEIQMKTGAQSSFWPTTERELERGRNAWPERAMLLAQANIKLTDPLGKHWTPRLERTKKRKRTKRKTDDDSDFDD